MAQSASGTKSRWLVSATVAAAMMVVLFGLFRLPSVTPRPSERGAAKPSIKVKPGRTDELALQDLTPLFLPTRYNAEPSAIAQPEPGRTFFDTDAVKLKFGGSDPDLHLPAAFRAPSTPTDALANSPGPVAAGIGRADASVVPQPAHGAYIEVFAASTGESVLAQTLPMEARPTAGGHEIFAWKPVEFLAAVDAVGLVGPVVVTSASGTEEVDNFFRNYLARTFHLGDRLTPGFYRIVVGP